MANVDRSKMNLNELKAHEETVKKKMKELEEKQRPIIEAREKIDQILSDSALKIEDIYPEKFKAKRGASTRKRAFYYRNPDNHSEV